MNPAAPAPLSRSPPLASAPSSSTRLPSSVARLPLALRCVHCHTTETPLWRAGPAGPKTLCNACGVRWKKTGSVIPRAKRPSTSSTAPSHISPIRKRARPNSHSSPNPPPHHPADSENRPPPPSPPDPRVAAAAAAAAAAALPAPKPVSVFRVADAARSKYESVFSGLMVVNRAAKPADEDLTRGRTRTQTTRGSAFFAEFAPPPPPLKLPGASPIPVLPCPSPPPVEKEDEGKEGGGVYVTEVHAPSPSPSPPPMPRVQRRKEGGGFTLLLAAVADEGKHPPPQPM